jgi:hypothetical protein
VTPRRASRLPVVLARDEVARLLQAAPSLRDKLLLGLLYATGMRVGEVVRLRARDLDPARGFIRVVDGKGRKDRDVMLPASFGPLLLRFQAQAAPEAFLFSATAAPDAHMVVRSAQRAMARALALAGITKNATCHSLRHAFATHLLEAGTDIRFIQKLLGHLQLETTTLYTRLAVLRPQSARSPLDTLVNTPAGPRELSVAATPPPPVGRFSLKLDVVTESTGRPSGLATLVLRGPPDVALGGIRVVEQRPGFVSIELPTLETWDAALARVPADVRARLEEPAFYARLQGALSERWMRARG